MTWFGRDGSGEYRGAIFPSQWTRSLTHTHPFFHRRARRRYLSAERVTLWRSLARSHGIVLPAVAHSGSARAVTRNACNLKMAFLRGFAAKQRALDALADREIWQMWMAMHARDSPASVRRLAQKHPDIPLTHALRFYGHRTLAMLAAWRGRLRMLQEVAAMAGPASLTVADDGGFTPLCFAAWAGHDSVVSWLVAQGVPLDAQGVPPLTSSCGGRGPFTAEVMPMTHNS